MPLFRSNERTNDSRFKEKNIVSAILGTATIVILCASLVEPVWFRLEGGKCCRSYLGVNAFFGSIGSNTFKKSYNCDTEKENEYYEYCINSKILMLIQVIIILCILAICTSVCSFVLDILAPRKRPLWKLLKRYAFGYVLTVLFAATSIGFCYWASEEIFKLQRVNKQYPGSRVTVTFSTGVYLLTAGGVIAIFATASNLIRHYPTEEEERAELLLEEDTDEDDAHWSNIAGPEPPAYVP